MFLNTWEGGTKASRFFFPASWCGVFASFGDACNQKTRQKHGFWPISFSKKTNGSNVALLVKSYSAIEAVAQLPSGAKGWKTAPSLPAGFPNCLVVQRAEKPRFAHTYSPPGARFLSPYVSTPPHTLYISLRSQSATSPSLPTWKQVERFK